VYRELLATSWPLHTWPLTFVTSKALYTRKLSIHGVCTYLATDFREFKSLCKYTFENFKVTLQKYLALGKLRFFNFFLFFNFCLPARVCHVLGGQVEGLYEELLPLLAYGGRWGGRGSCVACVPEFRSEFLFFLPCAIFFSSLVRQTRLLCCVCTRV